MPNRYVLSAPLDKRGPNNDQTYWVNNVGVAFPQKRGDGFIIKLDAVPVPGEDGRITIFMSPPKPKQSTRQSGYEAPGDAGSGGGYDAPPPPIGDDDIPF